MTVFFVESYCFALYFAHLFVPLNYVSEVLSLGNSKLSQLYLVFRSLIRTFVPNNNIQKLQIYGIIY